MARIPIALQLFSVRKECAGDLPRTLEAARTALALPLYSHMTDEDQQRVIGAVESLLG